MPNRVSGLELEKTIKNYIQCTSNVNISYLLTSISCEKIPVSNNPPDFQSVVFLPPQLWVANGNLAIHLRPKAPRKAPGVNRALGGHRVLRKPPKVAENYCLLPPLFWREQAAPFFLSYHFLCKNIPKLISCQNTLCRGRNIEYINIVSGTCFPSFSMRRPIGAAGTCSERSC